jgi:hypothetical protein
MAKFLSCTLKVAAYKTVKNDILWQVKAYTFCKVFPLKFDKSEVP